TGTFPTEGEAFEVMMDHVLDEWGADATVKREHRILARDGWRCAVPICTSRRQLHAHHIVPRSQGGGDEDSNRLTLCVSHHLRGVHGGTLEITGKAPDELLFKLGIRPDGPPLAVYRSGGVIVESS
ncbi:MAG: HNH endonuclease, partial [Myxococcota bacterium]